MPNVARVLKEEISRISRKETKAAVSVIRKPSVKLRKDVAGLKKQMAALEKECRSLRAVLTRVEDATGIAPVPEKAERVRITAKGMRALRRQLRLSVAEFAKLLGITSQAVYVWEQRQGVLRVRTSTRAAVLAVRGIGAREARKRLAEMKKAKKPARRRRR